MQSQEGKQKSFSVILAVIATSSQGPRHACAGCLRHSGIKTGVLGWSGGATLQWQISSPLSLVGAMCWFWMCCYIPFGRWQQIVFCLSVLLASESHWDSQLLVISLAVKELLLTYPFCVSFHIWNIIFCPVFKALFFSMPFFLPAARL